MENVVLNDWEPVTTDYKTESYEIILFLRREVWTLTYSLFEPELSNDGLNFYF